MKKSIICFAIALTTMLPAGAAKLPDNVENFVKTDFPQSTFRFDGMVILPDNTLYLPLIPSKFNDNEKEAKIKFTIPAGKTLAQKPDAIILDNDYVLLKLISNNKGKTTVINMDIPPLELRTGLLPQDLLVPKNFVVPATLRNIVGNLSIPTTKDNGLVIPVTQPKTGAIVNSLDKVPVLKDKVMYITTPLSKNIQVVTPERKIASYQLAQEEVPISIKSYKDFVLVTSFDKKSMDVISLADEKVIKEVSFKTQPDEIIIDEERNLAYVSSGEDASIYVIDLSNMTMKKQLRLNGMCEKVLLSEDGTKLFYNDKQTREIWAIELDNNYLMKEIGRFPNVSKIAYVNDKVYITSRTKNKLAIVDYETLKLLSENQTVEKPVDMLVYNNDLFVLGAAGKMIDIVDTTVDKITGHIELSTNQFPTKMTRVNQSNIVLITDATAGGYSVLDLDKKQIVANFKLEIPVGSVCIAKKIKKIGS